MRESIPTERDRSPTIRPGRPLGAVRESGLVAAGGAVGSLARAAVDELVTRSAGAFVVETQLVNGLGAFALGLLLARLERQGPRPRLRAFLAVGVLGAFTTYSTLIADARALDGERFGPSALAYVAASIAVGIVAFGLGARLEGSLARRPRPPVGRPAS